MRLHFYNPNTILVLKLYVYSHCFSFCLPKISLRFYYQASDVSRLQQHFTLSRTAQNEIINFTAVIITCIINCNLSSRIKYLSVPGTNSEKVEGPQWEIVLSLKAEMFPVIQFLLLTSPNSVKSLLAMRLHHLEKAQRKSIQVIFPSLYQVGFHWATPGECHSKGTSDLVKFEMRA